MANSAGAAWADVDEDGWAIRPHQTASTPSRENLVRMRMCMCKPECMGRDYILLMALGR